MNIPSYWKEQVEGSSLVSIKIGGIVRYLARPKTMEDLAETMSLIKEHQLTWKPFGGGSNLILADEGFDGVLVQPAFNAITVLSPEEVAALGVDISPVIVPPRYSPEEGPEFLQLHQVESGTEGEKAYVEMGAGVPWGQAVAVSLQKGFSGLHWFARIPCQVGGAVFNNIHGELHLLSEAVAAIRTFDPATGQQGIISAKDAEFGYDQSVFHHNGQIITSVIFCLTASTPEEAKTSQAHYLEWTKEKARVQPAGANCGSVFQNLTPQQLEQSSADSASAAWYVDKAGLKGHLVGSLRVYPGHGNFIVNEGGATQAQFIELVSHIRKTVAEKFGVDLEPEAECIDQHGNRLPWPTNLPA